MDITLFYLLRYGGISAKLLKEISKEQRYVDFWFLNQRILKNGFYNSGRYKRVNRILENNELTYHRSVFDSVFLLVAFNAPLRIVKILFQQGYRNIRKLVKLNSYEFNEIVDAKTNTLYNKISEAITKYTEWVRQNKEIVIEIVILDYLQHSEEELFINILNHVKQYFKYKSLCLEPETFYEVIKKMEEVNLIYIKSEDSVGLYQLNLHDLLSSDFEDSVIFKRYIGGESFREIAKDKGVKHQRIQQIYSQLIDLLPTLKEDTKYKDIFIRYNFSKDSFIDIFDESVKVYNYLNYKYKKGDENVISYLLNYDYPESFVKKFAMNRGIIINHENEIQPITKQNLLNNYIYENRNRIFTYEKMMKEINNIFIEYGVEPYDESKNMRALQGIVEHSNKIISSNDGTFRYYNLDGVNQEDINLLREIFDLPVGIYNGQKIYDKNKEIMEELNLVNGNEVFDLYNKLNLGFPNVNKIIRRSEAQIGNKGKEKFIEEILIEFNGESLDDVEWYLFDEYGLNKDSIRNYILNKFRYFVVDRKIKVNQPETEIEEISKYINNTLSEGVYSLRELNNKLSEVFDETISINNFMLKDTDYKVRDRYIIRKKYATPIAAIQDWIIQRDFFNLTEAKLTTELTKSSFFYNAINELLKNFKIFRFNEDLYISKDRLKKAGIYQEEIDNLLKSAEQYFFASGNKYMTIKSLLSEGFTHPLIEKGFENIFFEEILRNSSKLETINTSPRIFYEKGSESKHRSDFIYHLVKIHQSIDYQDLLNVLLKDYALSYDRFTVNAMLADTEAFYSKETQKYYKNKKQYYMEVYGK